MLYVKTANGGRKRYYNPRSYAMGKEEAYMKASCYHPDRKPQRSKQWWLDLPKPEPVERGW